MAFTKEQLDAYIQGLYDDDGQLSSADNQKIINYILSNGEPETDPRDLIQIRRGDFANLPILAQGEMAFTLDTNELFIGGLNGNIGIGNNKIIYVTKYGADETGVQDSSLAIQSAINDLDNDDVLFFPKGNYKINNQINLNKKVNLVSQGNVKLFAGASIESIIKLYELSSFSLMTIDGFFFDGDSLAEHCLLIDGAINGCVRLSIKNSRFREAIKDGVRINPLAYNITFNNSMFDFNGRDGLRAIVEDSNDGQINAITINNNCIFNNNINAGINIMGVAHNIFSANIENNEVGIKIDLSQVLTGAYFAWAVNIENCYIENNIQNAVLINSDNGTVRTNINNNYIRSSIVDGGDTLIKCFGDLGDVILNMTDNNNQIGGAVVTYIDGGDSLSTGSLINGGIRNNLDKYINLGQARVNFDNLFTLPLPITNAFPDVADSQNKTIDILTLTTQRVYFQVTQDLTMKMLERMKVFIETDSTDYSIRMNIRERDLESGLVTKSTQFDRTSLNGDSLVSNTIRNNWGSYRIPENKIIEIDVQVLNSNGTYLYLNTPFISYI